MKIQFLKLIIVLVVCAGITVNSDAQRRGRSRNQNTTQQPADTTKQPTQVNNNNQQPAKYNPYGNIPIKMAPKTGGFEDTVKKSLRTDGVFEKGLNDRTPLEYEFLRKDDALFSERVWREIDTREKMNQPFRYAAQDDNGDQRFVSILVKAIRAGKVTAFNADDDRFTTPLDSSGFEKALNGGDARCDTNAVYNLNDPTKIDSFVVVCPTMNPDDIVKFRIKENGYLTVKPAACFAALLASPR